MSAIVTDQLRILNAKISLLKLPLLPIIIIHSFLANPNEYLSTWDEDPHTKRCDQENHNWDTIIGLKKVDSNNVRFAERIPGHRVLPMTCIDMMSIVINVTTIISN